VTLVCEATRGLRDYVPMRTLSALAVFIATAVLLLLLIGMLGGVGSVELLLVLGIAAAATAVWLNRSRRRDHPAGHL
jgi:hypothetical protein